jgi:hypothetical protein
LRVISCDYLPARDAEIQRSIKTFSEINGKPTAAFFK